MMDKEGAAAQVPGKQQAPDRLRTRAVRVHVLSFLGGCTVSRCLSVCRYMRTDALRGTLWADLCRARWPNFSRPTPLPWHKYRHYHRLERGSASALLARTNEGKLEVQPLEIVPISKCLRFLTSTSESWFQRCSHALWSPSGAFIAQMQSKRIIFSNARNENHKVASNLDQPFCGFWSPDSTQFCFLGGHEGGLGLLKRYLLAATSPHARSRSDSIYIRRSPQQ
jgi:hypothetical protein